MYSIQFGCNPLLPSSFGNANSNKFAKGTDPLWRLSFKGYCRLSVTNYYKSIRFCLRVYQYMFSEIICEGKRICLIFSIAL